MIEDKNKLAEAREISIFNNASDKAIGLPLSGLTEQAFMGFVISLTPHPPSRDPGILRYLYRENERSVENVHREYLAIEPLIQQGLTYRLLGNHTTGKQLLSCAERIISSGLSEGFYLPEDAKMTSQAYLFRDSCHLKDFSEIIDELENMIEVPLEDNRACEFEAKEYQQLINISKDVFDNLSLGWNLDDGDIRRLEQPDMIGHLNNIIYGDCSTYKVFNFLSQAQNAHDEKPLIHIHTYPFERLHGYAISENHPFFWDGGFSTETFDEIKRLSELERKMERDFFKGNPKLTCDNYSKSACVLQKAILEYSSWLIEKAGVGKGRRWLKE